MKPDERLLLQAILDKNDQVSLRCFEEWAAMTDLDNIEGGSYRLIPALYKRIARISDEFTFKNRMKGIYRYFVYRNNLTLHRTKEVLLALNARKIPYIVLKGGALLASYYEDKGIRPMNDLDILVDDSYIDETVKLLNDVGWKPKDQESLLVNHHVWHAATFTNIDGMELDLHWHVVFQCCWDGVDNAYWENTEKASLVGADINILNPTLLLLHACSHGLQWNEMSSIRWIVDAITILEKRREDIDWQLLIQECKAKKLTHTIKKAVEILREDFGADIPDSFIYEINRIQVSREEKKLNEVLSNTSKYRYIKIRWYLYSIGMTDKNLISKIVGLPSYLQEVWSLKSKKDIVPTIITKVKAKRMI